MEQPQKLHGFACFPRYRGISMIRRFIRRTHLGRQTLVSPLRSLMLDWANKTWSDKNIYEREEKIPLIREAIHTTTLSIGNPL